MTVTRAKLKVGLIIECFAVAEMRAGRLKVFRSFDRAAADDMTQAAIERAEATIADLKRSLAELSEPSARNRD